jgi:hypothetical protein
VPPDPEGYVVDPYTGEVLADDAPSDIRDGYAGDDWPEEPAENQQATTTPLSPYATAPPAF